MLKVLIPVAAAAALLTVVPAAADEHETDMTLEEVLAAHFETIGGEKAWRAIESVTMTGNMTFNTPNGAMEAPTTMWFKSPNMTRMEFVIQGMTGIQAFDGETAWMVMPFMGKPDPEAMPDEMAENMSEQADINPLLDWKDKGYELELVGKEEVDGTEAYKVKLTRPSGNVRHYYFESESFLVFKVEGKTQMQGAEVDNSVVYSAFKEVGDVVFPFSMEMRQGGPEAPPQVITVAEIDLTTEVAASKFDMEAQKAAMPAKADG